MTTNTSSTGADIIGVESLPCVSVIMITKGRHELAGRAIHSILNCGYPRQKIELIVVEETAAPQTFDGSDVYESIPMLNLGFGYARNRGVSRATHQIIAFVDDDCIVDAGWLRELVVPGLLGVGAAAVAGAVLLPPGSGPIGQCENILGFPGGGLRYIHNSGGLVVSCSSFSTCNCAVRRSAIDEAGGFCETLRYGGEDASLSRLIAKKHGLVFNPKAVARHQPRGKLPEIFRWFKRRGLADFKMQQAEHARLNEWIQMFFTSQTVHLAGAVLLIILAGLPLLPVFLLLLSSYYVVQLFRFRWSFAYYPSIKTLLLIPVVKVVMDIGMDAGYVVAILGERDKA